MSAYPNPGKKVAQNRAQSLPAVRGGDRVRIERDETRYPPRGTWPSFRGRTGTVVEINRDRTRADLTEFGVALGKVAPRQDGRGRYHYDTASVVWFKRHEIVPEAAQGTRKRRTGGAAKPRRAASSRRSAK